MIWPYRCLLHLLDYYSLINTYSFTNNKKISSKLFVLVLIHIKLYSAVHFSSGRKEFSRCTYTRNLNSTSTRIVSFCPYNHHEWHHCVVETDIRQWIQRLSFFLSNSNFYTWLNPTENNKIFLPYVLFVCTYKGLSWCKTHLHNDWLKRR